MEIDVCAPHRLSSSPFRLRPFSTLRHKRISLRRRRGNGLPQLHSLLVSHRGELILKHYAPKRPNRLANIKSASKSIISTLVGIAIARKLIPAVYADRSVVPGTAQDPDKRKQTITIENLLTMQSGLESTSSRNYGQWVKSRNWVGYAWRARW